MEQSLYRRFFADPRLTVVSLTPDLLEDAETLAVRHGLKALDAIHAATAVRARVDVFASADKRFARVTGLPVVPPAAW